MRPPEPSPHPVKQGYDLVVLRPFGLVQLVVGAALFPVFYPVTLVTGGSDHVLEYFVTDPAERTFRRPLGRL